MAQLEPLAAEFHRDGAQLAYIAAEKRGGMFKPEAFLQNNPVSYPFLLDEDRAVTKLIDAGKMIRYLYRGSNQLDRAPMEQVVEAVKRIRN
jgi:hypothetical protein